ncbi:hypothetical protein JG687_00016002, partial [Phytophthora cactorum]
QPAIQRVVAGKEPPPLAGATTIPYKEVQEGTTAPPNDHQNNGILRHYFQLKRSKRSLSGGGATVSWSICRPSHNFAQGQ